MRIKNTNETNPKNLLGHSWATSPRNDMEDILSPYYAPDPIGGYSYVAQFDQSSYVQWQRCEKGGIWFGVGPIFEILDE